MGENPTHEGGANMKRIVATGLLTLASVAASAATITLIPQPDYPYLGVSCGGVLTSTYVTGFDANGNIRGEVYARTQCGVSGRGGGYQETQYESWHSILWDIEGAVIETLSYDGIAPDPNFSATDANGNTIHNGAIPGTTQYTGLLETPVAGPATGMSGPTAPGDSAQLQTPASSAGSSGGHGGSGELNWIAILALLIAGMTRLARR
jgi:hypothetical protein